ncbi:hypothetical protein V8E36_004431 [Tilletia maclaganii]
MARPKRSPPTPVRGSLASGSSAKRLKTESKGSPTAGEELSKEEVLSILKAGKRAGWPSEVDRDIIRRVFDENRAFTDSLLDDVANELRQDPASCLLTDLRGSGYYGPYHTLLLVDRLKQGLHLRDWRRDTQTRPAPTREPNRRPADPDDNSPLKRPSRPLLLSPDSTKEPERTIDAAPACSRYLTLADFKQPPPPRPKSPIKSPNKAVIKSPTKPTALTNWLAPRTHLACPTGALLALSRPFAAGIPASPAGRAAAPALPAIATSPKVAQPAAASPAPPVPAAELAIAPRAPAAAPGANHAALRAGEVLAAAVRGAALRPDEVPAAAARGANPAPPPVAGRGVKVPAAPRAGDAKLADPRPVPAQIPPRKAQPHLGPHGAAGTGPAAGQTIHAWQPPPEWRPRGRYPVVNGSQLLGQGTFGQVYLCRDLLVNKDVAKKRQFIRQRDNGIPDRYIRREIQALQAVQGHASIVELRDVVFHRDGNKMGYVDIVLPLAVTSLANIIRNTKRNLDVLAAKTVTRQILEGLQWMHQHKWVHLDLKPGNILVFGDYRCQISDFGLSNALTNERLPTPRGTLGYRPPEDHYNLAFARPSMDIWPVGTVYAEMRKGIDVFDLSSDLACFKSMLDTVGNTKPTVFLQAPNARRIAVLDKEEQRFVRQCWTLEPTQRPSATELLADGFWKRFPVPDRSKLDFLAAPQHAPEWAIQDRQAAA